MRFVICCPVHNADHSNGILSMLILCQTLSNLGYASYVFPTSGWPHEDDPLPVDELLRVMKDNPEANNTVFNLSTITRRLGLQVVTRFPDGVPPDVIVIYPETVSKNILKANRVIRYFGNKDGILRPGIEYKGGNERIFTISHSKIFCHQTSYILFFPHVDAAFLGPSELPTQARTLTLTYVGKGSLYQDKTPIVPGSVEVTRFWPSQKGQLATMLRHSKFLFTYDHWSNVNLEAVMCGAIPVFIGKDPWTPFNIDNAELGPLPRLTSDHLDHLDLDRLDAQFFASFENRRCELRQRVTALCRDYASEVKRMVDSVRIFFKEGSI